MTSPNGGTPLNPAGWHRRGRHTPGSARQRRRVDAVDKDGWRTNNPSLLRLLLTGKSRSYGPTAPPGRPDRKPSATPTERPIHSDSPAPQEAPHPQRSSCTRRARTGTTGLPALRLVSTSALRAFVSYGSLTRSTTPPASAGKSDLQQGADQVRQPADHATENEDGPASGDVRTARLLVAGQFVLIGILVLLPGRQTDGGTDDVKGLPQIRVWASAGGIPLARPVTVRR